MERYPETELEGLALPSRTGTANTMALLNRVRERGAEMNRAFSAGGLALYEFSPRRATYEGRAFGAKQIPRRGESRPDRIAA
jgi:hypothetical protein